MMRRCYCVETPGSTSYDHGALAVENVVHVARLIWWHARRWCRSCDELEQYERLLPSANATTATATHNRTHEADNIWVAEVRHDRKLVTRRSHASSRASRRAQLRGGAIEDADDAVDARACRRRDAGIIVSRWTRRTRRSRTQDLHRHRSMSIELSTSHLTAISLTQQRLAFVDRKHLLGKYDDLRVLSIIVVGRTTAAVVVDVVVGAFIGRCRRRGRRRRCGCCFPSKSSFC
mmetsp:Transcript_14029/g.32148  ORF Transcript_14029/g.32148 Transcript_14029/m.32148 type:complete len:233 (-) Transcript_14029:575-1273(-)